MSITPFQGRPEELLVQQLRLDPQNPRLPDSLQDASENDLLRAIVENYNAIDIARSIAMHGYFPSEPLIVIGRDDNSYLVVEGNRRLAAIKVLANPALANELDNTDGWVELAERATLPDSVPAIIAPDRQSVAPVIGYRHISGIEPWDPYQKARFVGSLIDDRELDFSIVADLVGERATDIASHYRNIMIAKQAKDEFEIDVSRVRQRFGVFTRAMTSLDLRRHIGAPAPSDVSPRQFPLPEDVGEKVKELISWLFGDDAQSAVIGESRDITDLGRVVSSPDGLRVLKQTRDLEAALIAAGGLLDRLLRRLQNANSHLEAAREDITSYHTEEEVRELLAKCQESLNHLTDLDD